MTASIQKNMHAAGIVETKLAGLTEAYGSRLSEEQFDDYTEAEDELSFYITRLYRDVGMLAERLSLPILARDIQRDFKRLSKGALLNMSFSHQAGELYSTSLQRLRGYFSSLTTITKAGSVSGLQVFQTILENTAIIIRDSGIQPSKESEVRNEIVRVLRYSFRDTQKEVSAAKLLKVYKPDIGIPSLMAAAEYKFVSSESALKSSLDGIYADMKGYGGHYDWRTFYAVIYMTEPFAHQKEWEAEFNYTKADINWTPILINGPSKK
ncbi:hypothetical protein EOK75_07205 [Pseudorhodobacter turbinis]|uniref:Uncharacterized protein n=1 Tax=Pseudorhodobacter turbinis TaxID=2500533 RepID=A0A4P8EFT7_9RHOB|nr:hypothetical protein [Pseudorhodobacter turbinis]QCO55553.1 hypothetical protein EOK75_07205 [Pseudorhodobacter turbinis]